MPTTVNEGRRTLEEFRVNTRHSEHQMGVSGHAAACVCVRVMYACMCELTCISTKGNGLLSHNWFYLTGRKKLSSNGILQCQISFACSPRRIDCHQSYKKYSICSQQTFLSTFFISAKFILLKHYMSNADVQEQSAHVTPLRCVAWVQGVTK